MNREIEARFFKSIVNLSITIKSIDVSIVFKPHKVLNNNVYQPIKLNRLRYNQSILNKFSYYISKYLKICEERCFFNLKICMCECIFD